MSLAAAGGAVFPAIEDDSKVELIPSVSGKQFLQIGFRLLHGSPVCEFPPLGQAVDVSIYGEGGNAEGLSHDDRGRFMSYAGQSFQSGEVGGNLSPVLFGQDPGSFGNGLGFERR